MNIKKDIISTFLTQFSVQLLGIISGIFIARMIGPEGKGAFAIYQANAQLLTIFFSLSLGNALTYFIPRAEITLEKLLGISILTIIFGAVLTFIVIILIYYTSISSFFFPSKYDGLLYIIWLYLFTVLSIIVNLLNSLFQGRKLFIIINKINIINSVLNLFLFGILFFINYLNIYEIDVRIVLYSVLIVTIINILQLFYFFKINIKTIPSYNISFKNEILQIFKYVFYTHSGLVVNFLNIRLSLWILNIYLNEFAIGLFSLASNLIIIFTMISTPIGNVLMPYLASESIKNKNKIFNKYSRINFSIVFFIAAIAYFASILFIPLLYGEGFKDAILLFQILIPGILFACISRLLSVYIASSNKQEYNLVSAIIGLLFSIFFSFVLIKNYGLIGASIASSITYIAICLSMMYFVHFKLKLKFGNYFFLTRKEMAILYSENISNVKRLFFKNEKND